jgi:hypothetical protein
MAMKLESISQLGLPFFGLTPKIIPEVRKQLFTQIHEIVFHGKGGYDWNTVYNMPIWLRKFTFFQIQEHYNKEAKAIESSKGNNKQQTLMDSLGNVKNPTSTPKTSYK